MPFRLGRGQLVAIVAVLGLYFALALTQSVFARLTPLHSPVVLDCNFSRAGALRRCRVRKGRSCHFV
jgi:hypothetical protein